MVFQMFARPHVLSSLFSGFFSQRKATLPWITTALYSLSCLYLLYRGTDMKVLALLMLLRTNNNRKVSREL
jgi:hypothetical protein